jgi:carboxypeptidase Taq
MIDFARQKAEYWGYGKGGDSPGGVYDGLLDIYEPGMGAAQVKAVFGPLGERLQALLKAIAQKPLPDVSFLDQNYDTGVQARFNLRLMDILGFDKSRGRLDVSAHPFTTTLGSNDVRITTRYFPRNLLSSIFSTIHESGHAFYEMAFPEALRGSCLADGASMAVHESQSRFWENVIGRSRPFWEALFPVLKEYFPTQLRDSRSEALYRGANMVRPSLIRVDADEVSYSLHIILRFELEEALFSGELEPQNLPSEWRRRMKEIIGVENDTDANGVLQDVHWSMGSFGYFPSYALGNLYSLQFLKKLRSDLPGFEDHIGRLRFDEVRRWLGENIHAWGCRLEPGELLKKVTGENLSASAFLEYIEGKSRGIYGI